MTMSKKTRPEYSDDQFWEELPKVLEKLERKAGSVKAERTKGETKAWA